MNGDNKLMYDLMKEIDHKNEDAHKRIEEKIDKLVSWRVFVLVVGALFALIIGAYKYANILGG